MAVLRIDSSSQTSSSGAMAKGGGGAGARAVARAAAEAPINAIRRSVEVADGGGGGSGARAMRGTARGGWVADAGSPRRLKDLLSPDGDGMAVTALSPRMTLATDLGSEVERVLGGGVVPGALVLVGGDPGVGKSTLLLQVAGLLGQYSASAASSSTASQPAQEPSQGGGGAGGEIDLLGGVMYASGEESVEQVAGRAARMGVDPENVYLYSATRLEAILEAVVQLQPSALIVDSIQTVFLGDATGSPGSVSQVRECTTALLHAAKTTGMPVFIVGHVTKSGDIAGPRVLEHIVDVVLYLEGDADRAVRMLRGHKNRYGSTDEVGVFEMAEGGLRPVPSPSALFMGERIVTPDVSSAPTVTVQGSRPFMLEVQALCAERAIEQGVDGATMMSPPMRTAVGFRPERLQLLMAVLAKFVLGRKVHRHDVFVNIVGGLKLEDPSTDAAVALAIASSLCEKALPVDMAFFGEVGLGGELRPVAQAERRLGEAAAMGFKRVLMPLSGTSKDLVARQAKLGLEVVACNTLGEALEASLGIKPTRGGGGGGARGSGGAPPWARRGRGRGRGSRAGYREEDSTYPDDEM